MKAKAAVFMGANVPFEVREFEITDTPAGRSRSRGAQAWILRISVRRSCRGWGPWAPMR